MDILTEQLTKIKRGVSEIISEKELIGKLEFSIKNKVPLKVKAGFDPTAADIHLGVTVLLKKLRHFQDLGHIVFFLIGDFTARIGDPSGQNKTRPPLSEESIKENSSTYKLQIFKILDPEKTEIVFNNDWFSKMSIYDVMGLFGHSTVSQLLARADFRKRLKDDIDIRTNEFIYPLLQAYDSVHLKADIEIGGLDQKFNLLLGRELQGDFGQKEQVAIMLPLLEGIDGIKKMSKSLGNYIGINEPPEEIFGKIMSISDSLMYKYYELLTDEDLSEVKNMHPREAKVKLGALLITQYYNKSEAQEARESFERVFKNKEAPLEVPEYKIEKQTKIMDILTAGKMVKSRNEARRLIQQGGVIFDNEKIKDEDFLIAKSGILKSGARRFLKVILS